MHVLVEPGLSKKIRLRKRILLGFVAPFRTAFVARSIKLGHCLASAVSNLFVTPPGPPCASCLDCLMIAKSFGSFTALAALLAACVDILPNLSMSCFMKSSSVFSG